MTARVLFLTTSYDYATTRLSAWAHDLQRDLLEKWRCEVCIVLEGEALCRAGDSLREVVERVDFIVFFGHGKNDQWIALPSYAPQGQPHFPTIPLVDAGGVAVLQGRNIYAACCHSLSQLGPAFANAFQPGRFVGYAQAFDVHFPNELHFADTVKNSVVDFVINGSQAAVLATTLQNDWSRLELDFSGPGGRLRNSPDAWVAEACARSNAKSAGWC